MGTCSIAGGSDFCWVANRSRAGSARCLRKHSRLHRDARGTGSMARRDSEVNQRRDDSSRTSVLPFPRTRAYSSSHWSRARHCRHCSNRVDEHSTQTRATTPRINGLECWRDRGADCSSIARDRCVHLSDESGGRRADPSDLLIGGCDRRSLLNSKHHFWSLSLRHRRQS